MPYIYMIDDQSSLSMAVKSCMLMVFLSLACPSNSLTSSGSCSIDRCDFLETIDSQRLTLSASIDQSRTNFSLRAATSLSSAALFFSSCAMVLVSVVSRWTRSLLATAISYCFMKSASRSFSFWGRRLPMMKFWMNWSFFLFSSMRICIFCSSESAFFSQLSMALRQFCASAWKATSRLFFSERNLSLAMSCSDLRLSCWERRVVKWSRSLQISSAFLSDSSRSRLLPSICSRRASSKEALRGRGAWLCRATTSRRRKSISSFFISTSSRSDRSWPAAATSASRAPSRRPSTSRSFSTSSACSYSVLEQQAWETVLSQLEASNACRLRPWFCSLRASSSSRNLRCCSSQKAFSCSSLLLKPCREVSSRLMRASTSWPACSRPCCCSRVPAPSISSLSSCFSLAISASLFLSSFTLLAIFSSCSTNRLLARSSPSRTASSATGEPSSFSSISFRQAASLSPRCVSSARRDSRALHLSLSSTSSLEQLSRSVAASLTALRSSTSFLRISASLEEMSFMYFSNSCSRTLFLQVMTSTLFLASRKPRQYSFSSALPSPSSLVQASQRYFSSLYSTFHRFSSPRSADTSLYYRLLELGDSSGSLLLSFLGERVVSLALNWPCRLLMSCSYFCSVALEACSRSASRWLCWARVSCSAFSVFSQRARYSSHFIFAPRSSSFSFRALYRYCSASASRCCSMALTRASCSALTPATSCSKWLVCFSSSFLPSSSLSLVRLAIFWLSSSTRRPWSLSEVGTSSCFSLLWASLRASRRAPTSSASDCSDLKRAASRKATLSSRAWHFSASSRFLARYLPLRLRSSVLRRLFSSSTYLPQSQLSVARFSSILRAVSPKIFSLETDCPSESSTGGSGCFSERRFSMGLRRMPCFFSIMRCTSLFRCSSYSFRLLLPSPPSRLGELKASRLSLGGGVSGLGLISERLGSQQC